MESEPKYDCDCMKRTLIFRIDMTPRFGAFAVKLQ